MSYDHTSMYHSLQNIWVRTATVAFLLGPSTACVTVLHLAHSINLLGIMGSRRQLNASFGKHVCYYISYILRDVGVALLQHIFRVLSSRGPMDGVLATVAFEFGITFALKRLMLVSIVSRSFLDVL